MKKICSNPFKKIEIHADGSLRCCCGICNDYLYFGNICEQTIEEIWNNRQMQDFRHSILDGSYKYCHREMCEGADDIVVEDTGNFSERMNTLPRIIELSLDGHCNCRCIMCRDVYFRDIVNPDIFKMIDKTVIPYLSECEIVVLNMVGELFVSELCKNFIKKTAKLYPKLKFGLATNGILCTPKELDKLGILNNRIEYIVISLQAATAETHEKIMRCGNKFEQCIKNIEDLKKYVKEYVPENREKQIPEGKIGAISFTFVISSINYFEIIEMAKLCLKYNIDGVFWNFRNWKSSEMCQNFEKYDVTNPNHPNYFHLKELLQNEIFDSPLISLNGILKNIRNS